MPAAQLKRQDRTTTNPSFRALPSIISQDFPKEVAKLGKKYKFIEIKDALSSELNNNLYSFAELLINLARRYSINKKDKKIFHRTYAEILSEPKSLKVSERTLKRYRKKLVEMGVIKDLPGTWKNRSRWCLNEEWFNQRIDDYLCKLGVLLGHGNKNNDSHEIKSDYDNSKTRLKSRRSLGEGGHDVTSHIIRTNCSNNISNLKSITSLDGERRLKEINFRNKDLDIMDDIGYENVVPKKDALPEQPVTKGEKYLMTAMFLTLTDAQKIISNYPADKIKEAAIHVRDTAGIKCRSAYFKRILELGVKSKSKWHDKALMDAEQSAQATAKAREKIEETQEMLKRYSSKARSSKETVRKYFKEIKRMI